MPDTKLKIAMEEIKAVLSRHDVAAIVYLASQTHMEYLHRVDPTWSCARLESHGDETFIRVRATAADYGSPEARNVAIKDTVGMILGFLDTISETERQLKSLTMTLAKQVGSIEHWSKHEPGQ